MNGHVNTQVFNTPDGLLPGECLLAVVDLWQIWSHVAPGRSNLEMLLLIQDCFLALS